MTEAERLDAIREFLKQLDEQELRKAQQQLAVYRRRHGMTPYLLWSGA